MIKYYLLKSDFYVAWVVSTVQYLAIADHNIIINLISIVVFNLQELIATQVTNRQIDLSTISVVKLGSLNFEVDNIG